MLLLAHIAHWTWVLYLPPVLIVVVSILRTTLSEKREQKSAPSAGVAGEGSPRG